MSPSSSASLRDKASDITNGLSRPAWRCSNRAWRFSPACEGTGSVEWEWLPILKQSLIQTPVQFSLDLYVAEMPGRMGICMPYVVYPINSSRVLVRELFYIQIA